jgi:hypothetical protein
MDTMIENPLSFLPSLSVHFVWITAVSLFLVFFVYTGILLYHWLTYGINKAVVSLVMSIYFIVSIVLLGVIFSSALAVVL